MICELDIIRAFEFFIREVEENKKGKFFYVPDAYVKKSIINFIEHNTDVSTGYNWLFDYFGFQFERILSQRTHSARVRERISLSMAISKVAIEKWNKRPLKHWKYFVTIHVLTIYPNITFKKFKSYLKGRDKKEQIDYININSIEEKHKKFKGSDSLRLLICLETTTLFNHLSPICSHCGVRDLCKGILKTNLPSIYEARGYN